MKTKNNLLKGVAVACLLSITAVSYGSSLTKMFTPKLARASDVYCYCDSGSSNQVCAANNGGVNCASGDNIHCSDYNDNCAG